MENDRQTRRLFALLREGGVSERVNRLQVMSVIMGRKIATSDDLSQIEVRAVIDTLDYWKRQGELGQRCWEISTTGEPPGDIGLKMTDARGHQIIQVQFEPDGEAFTYTWAGDGELSIGDVVRTPSPWWLASNEPGIATVCALGSAYAGTITVLTKRAES